MNIRLLRFTDKYVGAFLTPLCFFMKAVLQRNFILGDHDIFDGDILVVKLWGIGEAVNTLPAVKALREHFPKAHITVLTTRRVFPVYSPLEYIDRVEVVNLNLRELISYLMKNLQAYDISCDFEPFFYISAIITSLVGKISCGYSHSIRSLLYNRRVKYDDCQHVSITIMDVVRLVGAKIKYDALLPLPVSASAAERLDKVLNAKGINPHGAYAGICAGCGESARERMWPAENFAELAEWIFRQHGLRVVLTGSSAEKELNDSILDMIKVRDAAVSVAGEISLTELFELARRSVIFISNDTGPMHIAAAQGTSTIGLFGPNLPVRFGPYGMGNAAIYHGKHCSPCINVHHGKINDCREEVPGDCMRAIATDEVKAVFNKLIKQVNRRWKRH
jgi:heptosyltransferase II